MKFLRGLAILMMATGIATMVSAQATVGSVGNIYGTVTDETGGVLPGVAVTLSGVGARQTATTGSQGEFRFLRLSPGSYQVKTELSGFAVVERNNVQVSIGTNTEITIPMKIANVATTITVNDVSPILDTRKERAGSNFSNEELKEIPTSRDPWGVLQMTAGVQLDNVQTGSQQSGQQSVFIGKGTNFNNNAWNVDGVSFTDLAAVGASPSYWDFDQFQEMQMTTGGSDPSIVTPGVTLNMVTKRGTNEPHGSARIFYTPGELSAHNLPSEAKDEGLTSTDHINSVRDFGAEAGGPIWPDKAWLWGSYGHNDISIHKVSGLNDNTQLDNYGAKLNIQPVESNSFTGFYFRGGKEKQGRFPTGTFTHYDANSVWNQHGPSRILKVDDSQVFGPNFVANVAWSFAETPFSLTPAGGTANDTYRDANLVWRNSYQVVSNYRPQHQLQGSASLFFNTGAAGHEIKFGGAYIHFITKTGTRWSGTGNWGDERQLYPDDPDGFTQRANVTRGSLSGQELKVFGAFIGDTITLSNLTVNLGVRYDNQKGKNLPSNIAANPIFSDVLTAINYPGGSNNVNTKDWQPRLGITYALGSERKTLLRASYARFADQGGASPTAFDNPIGGISTAQFRWNDANHNHIVDAGELGACQAGVCTPGQAEAINNPISPNVVDPDLKAPKTDEIVVGVDHELFSNFAVGASYTYRKRKDFMWRPYTQLTRADYAPCTTAACGDPIHDDGTVDAFDLNGNSLGHSGVIYYVPNLPADFDGGRTLTNRPDYSTEYNGVEVQLTKRLENRWMAHASFGVSNWKQKVGNTAKACIDPTNEVDLGVQNPFPGVQGNTCANDIGWDYAGTTYINAKWQFNVAGLYQLPLNFNVSANLFGRQGYPIPYLVDVDPGDGLGTRYVAIGKADSKRLKNVYELDMRLEKVVPLFQKADLTLSMDVFNVFNANTITFRNNFAGDQEGGAAISAIQVPRTLRFGARVSF